MRSKIGLAGSISSAPKPASESEQVAAPDLNVPTQAKPDATRLNSPVTATFAPWFDLDLKDVDPFSEDDIDQSLSDPKFLMELDAII